MVKRCEVSGCPVRQGKGSRLFYFPKCEKRRLLWQSWIRVNRPGWSPKTNSRICELHFAPNCYEKRQDGKKILKNTAIPSLQEESLENFENAEHLKSLPERFQTSETRVCLSDVTNLLKAKKSAVLHDSDYLNCSTSASSKILPSQVSSITAQNVNVTGNALKKIILNLIKKAEKIGLRVNAVISDMGSDNKAMWNAFGVGCTRENVKTNIMHPVRPTNKLYFIPDPVHLFKNIKNMLESNKTIRLSADVCATENLSNSLVDIQHIEILLHHESKHEMKIAYRLKDTNLYCKNHYNKMKVSTASSVLNRRTETALKVYADYTNNNSFKTTAFFINLVDRWFNMMTNRSRIMALSKSNIEAYNEAITHLKKTQQVFRSMLIGKKGHWKPIQSGVIMATESILELQEYFLNEKRYKFLLTGRFTQDCLENLFSLIRFRQPIPNPLHVKQNLKVITITQVCSYSKITSYNNDVKEDNFEQVKLDFLKSSKKIAAAREKAGEVDAFMKGAAIYVPELQDNDMNLIDIWEWPIIYDIAGAVVKSVKKTMKVCDTCYKSVLWQDTDSHPFSIVVDFRSYGDSSLCKVSDSCFKAIMKAEITFQELRDAFEKVENIKLIDFIVEKLLYVWKGTNIPQCHNITAKILTRFFRMRFRMFNIQRKEYLEKENKSRTHSSKTIDMHIVVDRL